MLSRLLYGCETRAQTQDLLHRLEIFVLSCLLNILGVTVLESLHSDIIRQKCETPLMTKIIRERRLRWLGQAVGRMGNERLPKRMLFARTEEGHRKRATPRKSWAELARDDLVQIREYRWYKSCQDRANWRHKTKRGAT